MPPGIIPGTQGSSGNDETNEWNQLAISSSSQSQNRKKKQSPNRCKITEMSISFLKWYSRNGQGILQSWLEGLGRRSGIMHAPYHWEKRALKYRLKSDQVQISRRAEFITPLSSQKEAYKEEQLLFSGIVISELLKKDAPTFFWRNRYRPENMPDCVSKRNL